MKIYGRLFAALALAGMSLSASAQAPPPGSYQRNCGDLRMHGTTLSATCRREDGRTVQSSLDVAQCRANIENRNGRLKCASGVAIAPVPSAPPPAYAGPGYPAPGYRGPGYAPGYPPPGYPPPRYGEGAGYHEHCDALRHQAHDLRERIERTPYGEYRERLEHRLHEISYQQEECWHHH